MHLYIYQIFIQISTILRYQCQLITLYSTSKKQDGGSQNAKESLKTVVHNQITVTRSTLFPSILFLPVVQFRAPGGWNLSFHGTRGRLHLGYFGSLSGLTEGQSQFSLTLRCKVNLKSPVNLIACLQTVGGSRSN